jgi:hypothetical protein
MLARNGVSHKPQCGPRFRASWLFAIAKDGISAEHLRHALELGSHPTRGVADVAPAAVCAGAAGPGPAGWSAALPYHRCPLSALMYIGTQGMHRVREVELYELGR